MRLVDANLLIYARVSSFPQHESAHTWLDEKLNGPEPLGISWPSLLAFVRLITNPRIFERPDAVGEAWEQALTWMAASPAWIPKPTDRHVEILSNLLTVDGLRSNHIPDAHLSALAIEHGLILCSADTDFARFPGLNWENPLRS